MINQVLNDNYLVLDTIDEGGMAVIYRAVRLDNGFFVAVKVLKPEYAGNREYEKNFDKETEAMFSLAHRNIVQAIDKGECEGRRFFVMEYIPNNLSRVLEGKNGSVSRCIQISKYICGALSYAHERGIIHMDLKPQNILVKDSGEPVITDFGIAHNMSASEKTDEDGTVVGSVNYFSPEQAKGGKIDQRSDIYSLGVMMYQMATGKLPFSGEDALSVALKHVHQKPAAPRSINSAIPESLNRIIMKAMCKDPKNRYQTVNEMLADIEKCMEQKDGMYISVPNEDNYPKEKRSRGKIIAAVSAALLVVAAVLVLIIGQSSRVVYVPSLTSGTTEEEMTQTLTSIGLKVAVEYIVDASSTPGTVVSISPASRSALEPGDIVTITVVEGDSDNKMLYVKGRTVNEALEILSALKWKGISVEYVSNANYKDGEIISQSPEYGSVISSSSVIKITVNRLQQSGTTEVPLIKDMPVSEAAKLIKEKGMGKLFVYFEQREGQNAGAVIEQQPKDGNIANAGSNMTAWVQMPGESNYHGVYALDESILEDGMTLKVTAIVRDGEGAEVILLEKQVASKAEFAAQYESGIAIDAYVDSENPEERLYIVLYKNDTVAMYQRMTMYRK